MYSPPPGPPDRTPQYPVPAAPEQSGQPFNYPDTPASSSFPQHYYPPTAPVYGVPVVVQKDPNTGLILELIGLVGFQGIGWLWAGETAIGLLLLFGFWIFLAVEITLMFLLIGFCLLPLNLIVPIGSGIMLQQRLKARQQVTN